MNFPPDSLPEGLQARAAAFYLKRPFSIFWEVRFLLYLGVLFLSSGLGILIYKNIDTLGHQTILLLIAATTTGCFWYCAKKVEPFTWEKPTVQNSWTDYMLLLGALLFGTFFGYLQFKYAPFGSHHALVIGIPAVTYLFLAYRFDHRGVLQMGLSGICAAIGLVATPLAMLQENTFHPNRPVYVGLALSLALVLVARTSEKRNLKSHFGFSFYNFAVHISMLSTLTGMTHGGKIQETFFFLLLLGLTAGVWALARKQTSHYFLLCAVIYGYIGVTYWIIHNLFSIRASGLGSIYTLFFYFVFSCAGTIVFFLNMKKLLGIQDAGLSKE